MLSINRLAVNTDANIKIGINAFERIGDGLIKIPVNIAKARKKPKFSKKLSKRIKNEMDIKIPLKISRSLLGWYFFDIPKKSKANPTAPEKIAAPV